ncbi:ABC transporter ATP-binding protein [Aestuariicella sp. G3-2]|uniref:ABC transporter ATP-binding protein n=1 Tax=Pseudomaricurvus albidus TaxID=2842452 RepID=UPI001C0E45AF|nr:ABC transporter ATP-binding protein [Aestuariicella albida]MBU3068396.1 ABC transporter ATP-binding protein [Aestuariicella albida]
MSDIDNHPLNRKPDETPALAVDNLQVEFSAQGGRVQAVRGVSFSVQPGETLGVVGESGCGKSVTMMSIMGLIPMPPGRIVSGSAKLNGKELLHLPVKQLNKIRGVDISMVFQDPMSALNPTMRIGEQIAETLMIHRGMGHGDALKRAVDLLERTRIPEARKRVRQYPFEFSGGMLQRAVIAMSLACSPSVLVADEPTTALDVTIQNQVLELMREIQREEGMAIVLITHDLGVVARMADQVAVMYAGQIVERGSVDDIFYRSAHPYTLGLKAAMPTASMHVGERLMAIPGSPPDLFSPPAGCGYCRRCDYAMNVCEQQLPELISVGDSHASRCWLQHAQAQVDVDALYQPGASTC